MKKIGSATLVVIVTTIVFLIYATATYADVRHMKRMHDEYKEDIVEMYEQNYLSIEEEL